MIEGLGWTRRAGDDLTRMRDESSRNKGVEIYDVAWIALDCIITSNHFDGTLSFHVCDS